MLSYFTDNEDSIFPFKGFCTIRMRNLVVFKVGDRVQPVFEMKTLFFNMTYRKLYSQKFQITIPKEFDIHHLDFNHDNDDIINLLLLPTELHTRLHKAHRQMRMWEIKADAIESYSNRTLIKASMMKEMSEVLTDVAYWLRVKEMELLQIGGEFGYNYNNFRNGGKNC